MVPPLLQRPPTISLENFVGVSTQKPKRVKKVRRKKWRKKTHPIYKETIPPLTLATNGNDGNSAFNDGNSRNANNHIPDMPNDNHPHRYSDTIEEIQIKTVVQDAVNYAGDGMAMDRDELTVKDLR